jgi:CheY-like chemotaxis protein
MTKEKILQRKMNIQKREDEKKRQSGEDLPRKILVIDDEPLLLDLLVNLLSYLGYEVDSALNDQEASGKLEGQTYGLIFLDMKMPRMDGKQFYLKMKEYQPTLAKRIVFLTGDVANKETFDFISETKSFYLAKPFTIKELKDLLDRFFNPEK